MKLFPLKFIQGPLAGYSCAPFRVLATRYSQADLCYTEMISVNTLLYVKKPQPRFTDKDPEEGQLCYQLSAKHPQELSEAIKLVESKGANAIDLNCGCPQPKIRGKGTGSKHLDNPSQLAALIATMRSATTLPISIKIRIDPVNLIKNREIANIAEKEGCDFITVHGRHWTERYDTPCHIEPITDIVQHCKIPVIANGDVNDAASYQRMQKETGCHGIMIARAGLGKPWLIAQIREELAGNTFTPPSPQEIIAIFLEHVERLIKLENETVALLQARKLGKYYLQQFIESPDFMAELNQCSQFNDLSKLLSEHFEGLKHKS